LLILFILLVEYCPNEFVIDLAGKRKEWEGIVLLPMVNFEIVRQLYFDNLGKISVANKKRNIFGKSFKYEIDENNDHYFKSYIENCKIKIVLFEL
jgi:5'-3' exonuclease